MRILLLLIPVIALAGTEKEIVKVLKSGEVAEECMEIDSPKKLNYSFTSDHDVLFNLHYHEGEEVSYPVEEKPRRIHKGVYRPSHKQTYCLMWSNKAKQPVEIKYKYLVN